MARRYAEGRSYVLLGAELGLGPEAARAAIVARGVAIRQGAALAAGVRMAPATAEELATIRRERRTRATPSGRLRVVFLDGLTAEEREYGAGWRSQGDAPAAIASTSASRAAQQALAASVAEARGEGVAVREIARRFAMSETAVYRLLRRSRPQRCSAGRTV